MSKQNLPKFILSVVEHHKNSHPLTNHLNYSTELAELVRGVVDKLDTAPRSQWKELVQPLLDAGVTPGMGLRQTDADGFQIGMSANDTLVWFCGQVVAACINSDDAMLMNALANSVDRFAPLHVG